VYRARSGDLAGARSDLERAISCDPGGVRDREALARVLAQLGLLDEAREVIERSFFLDPEGFARIRQEIGGTVNPAAFRNTDTLEEIDQALENGANPEIQTALGTLAKISDPLAVNRLSEWLERLESGKLDPSLALDVLEAAAQRPTLASRVRDHESGLDPRDHLGPWRVTLRGGNATLGRDVYHRQDLGCANCHTKQGGVDGGPDLSGVGTRRYRAQLLEAIVFPTQEISPEYRESKAMPDGLHLLMSKRDLRDLIEYLAHLD